MLPAFCRQHGGFGATVLAGKCEVVIFHEGVEVEEEVPGEGDEGEFGVFAGLAEVLVAGAHATWLRQVDGQARLLQSARDALEKVRTLRARRF